MLVLGGAGAVGLGLTALAVTAPSAEAAGPAARPTRSPTATATATATATSTSLCALTENVTAGPYYLNVDQIRADVTEGKSGVALTLTVKVVNSTDCAAVGTSAVEIWHADALGEYSGYVGRNGHSEADDGTFLRGTQLTDSTGSVTFTTIVPGWYAGRAVHIHTKVHSNITVTSTGDYTGGNVSHTGQFFFAEDVVTAVGKVSPYSTNTVTRVTLTGDSIYDGGGVTSGLLTLTGSASAGYAGTITVGVNPSSTNNG